MLPSLLAGKVHALIARRWNNRVKGRDWYDLVFFVSRGVPPDLSHLEARLRASGHWGADTLTLGDARGLIDGRIDSLDIVGAREEAPESNDSGSDVPTVPVEGAEQGLTEMAATPHAAQPQPALLPRFEAPPLLPQRSLSGDAAALKDPGEA